jgi:tetratricopeptide (TPR) repeat protein
MPFDKTSIEKNSNGLPAKKGGAAYLLISIIVFTSLNLNHAFSQQNNYTPVKDDSLQLNQLNLYEEVEDEDAYQMKINRADMLFIYGRYKKAKEYYIEALAVYPGDPYARAKIKEIDSILEKQKIDFLFLPTINFEHPSTLVVFLLVIILYSIASMIILLVIILITRARREYLEKVKERLSEEYQTLLINFLYSPENDEEIQKSLRKIARTDFTRKLLIDQMIDLSINLKGKEEQKLRSLYFDMKLDTDSFDKSKSLFWHTRVKGFRELAFMNIPNARNIITKALKSNNSIVRMEAQLALVRLDEKDPYRFLDTHKLPFSLWEQNNIYEMIRYHDLPVPDFRRWLNVQNHSVVLFAIDMIRIFKQRDSATKLIPMLKERDVVVRGHLIKTLGSLKIKEAIPTFKEIFPRESFDNKMLILQALGKFEDETNIPFFKKVLDEEDEVYIQVEAARGIRDTGETGKKILHELFLSKEYRNYQIIIKQVMDKRI